MLTIIADDLSGAGDSGLQFAKRGLRTVVVTHRRTEPVHADVVVFDTDSRAATAAAAGARVTAAIASARRWGATTIFKKIDSTARGNLGAELDAVVTAGGYELAVVCPAFPATGRTLRWGILSVRGRALATTEFAADPVWPATDSRVYALIGRQSQLHLSAVSLEIVRQGDDALARLLARDVPAGVRVAVVDADTRADLDTIARTVLSRNGAWVAVGSAGLAEALADARALGPGAAPATPRPTTDDQQAPGPALVVVGSMNPRSVTQAQTLALSGAAHLVAVDPADLHDAAASARHARTLRATLTAGRSAGLWLDSTARSASDWLRAAYPGQDPATASRDVVSRLAAIAAEGALGARVAGLVATGGDTALALCDRLGADAIEVLGEVRPAIPRGRILGGAFAGRTLITKAGGFGDDDALVAAVRAIDPTA